MSDDLLSDDVAGDDFDPNAVSSDDFLDDPVDDPLDVDVDELSDDSSDLLEEEV